VATGPAVPDLSSWCRALFGGAPAVPPILRAAAIADRAVLFPTGWKKLLRSPVIFDGRNLYNPDQIRAHGFTYLSMGRP